MFDDVMVLARRELENFSGVVRDSFGQSIIDEVYYPMNQNLLSLYKLNEYYETQMNGVEKELQELRKIGSLPYEY